MFAAGFVTANDTFYVLSFVVGALGRAPRLGAGGGTLGELPEAGAEGGGLLGAAGVVAEDARVPPRGRHEGHPPREPQVPGPRRPPRLVVPEETRGCAAARRHWGRT